MAGKKTNKTELAELFGVTQKTIGDWQNRGMPIEVNAGRGHKNVYDSADCIKWFAEYRIAQRLGESSEGRDYLDKDREQARFAKAQADGKEIDNQIKRGELAPATFMTTALANVAAQITAVLDSIPQKLKRHVPKLTASDIDLVKREIAKTQNAAASIDVDLNELIEDYKRDKGGATTA